MSTGEQVRYITAPVLNRIPTRRLESHNTAAMVKRARQVMVGDTKYPVIRHLMVDDGEGVRCWFTLNEDGDTMALTLPTFVFNALPTEEVSEHIDAP